MRRYVLVCNIEGDALRFHEKVTSEVCQKFNKRRQKLPAHVTLKAPFETDKIDELVDMLNDFSKNEYKASMEVKGFGRFRGDVVYMDVRLSDEAKRVHDKLMDELIKIPWIELKKNEGKDRVFHCTIVSKGIQDKFNEIWEYVNQYKCNFDTYFDNMSLYIWENNTWIPYKRFKFKDT